MAISPCCPHYGSEYAHKHLCTICRLHAEAATARDAIWADFRLELESVFCAIDIDGNGRIDLKELSIVAFDAISLMDKIDTNDDKLISLKEWDAYFRDISGGDVPKATAQLKPYKDRSGTGPSSWSEFQLVLEVVFIAIDADGNGRIDMKELAAIDPKGASVAMVAMDKDSDQKISITEWNGYFFDSSAGDVPKAQALLKPYKDALANLAGSKR